MQELISAIGGVFRRTVRNDLPVPFASRGGMGSLTGGGKSGDDAAYDAYGSVGTLFSIVTQIGFAFSTTDWHLYKRTSTLDKTRRTEVTKHPFLTVWDKPNPFYTGKMLRRVVQMHLDLVGEGVILVNKVGGIPVELWPVRPDRIEPVKHPTKYISGYVYKGPDGEDVPLELDQVIHIKYPSPDPYRGMGPVQTVLFDIDAAKYGAEWNRNFFINGARPGGIIEVDYRMGDNEFKEFINRWREQHQGVANAHRVAVLENAKWVETSFSMEDMQFIEMRNLPRELIREAFAFPKPLLGTVDDVNRANAEAAKEIMAAGQTIPRLSLWDDVVNTWLLPQFANGENHVLVPDDPTPVNSEQVNADRNSRTSSAKALVDAGYHPDDVADAMGLPPMRFIGKGGTNQSGQSTGDGSESVEGGNVNGRAVLTRRSGSRALQATPYQPYQHAESWYGDGTTGYETAVVSDSQC